MFLVYMPCVVHIARMRPAVAVKAPASGQDKPMKLLVALLALYLCFTGLLYLMQRKLQYFPDTRQVEPAEVGLDGFSMVRLDTPDGERLVAWHAPTRRELPTIVYFQGNGMGLAARAERFKLMHEAGFGVLALGYRGYSGSTGTPSESGLMTDAEAAVRFLAETGVPPQHLVYYGESLGTGVAVQLAARQGMTPAALILEAPFTAAADIARTQYWYVPVGILMKDQFRSIDHIGNIAAPLFVLHGDADTIVPIGHGRQVFEAARDPKEMMVIPGGSHGLPLTPEIWQRLEDFMRRHAAAR